MLKGKLSFYIFLSGLLLSFSFVFLPAAVFAGTVLDGYKYSWSNNVGYINFANVIVGDSALSGYAWSKTHGWIKFNPAQGGVLNNGSGDLSGYAWGEQLGWINFNNVSINTATGRFSGTATGTLIGTLTFDCSNYCDVRTDWRPAGGAVILLPQFQSQPQSQPQLQSQSQSQSEKPKHIETNDQDLTIDPDQSGRYIKDTDKGQIIMEVPTASISGKTTFYIATEPLSQGNQYLVLPEVRLINSVFYDVYAKDQNRNFVHSFSSPITITLPVPINLQKARDLGVYWLNETNNQWALIPDAVFVDNKAVFQVNHLTRFAIFGVINEIQTETGNPPIKPSLPVPSDKSVKNQNALSNKKDQSPAGTGNPPESSVTATVKNNYSILWLLLILIIILWGYKKYQDRDKKSQ